MRRLELSDNALAVLTSRYLRRDHHLKIVESPAELLLSFDYRLTGPGESLVALRRSEA